MKESYYTREAGVLIARALADGLSFRDFEQLRIPRHHQILSAWKRRHPEFRRLVELGERARTDDRAREVLCGRPKEIVARLGAEP